MGTGLPPNLDTKPYSEAFDSLLEEARAKLDREAFEVLVVVLRVKVRGQCAALEQKP